MTKTILKFLTFLSLGLGAAYGQSILTNTTLSAAATSSARVITLTSATGVTAPSPTNPNLNTYLVTDSEIMSVSAVSGTQISVVRGVGGTAGRSHASGAVTFVLPAYLATFSTSQILTGSCTRGNLLALPVITTTAGRATFSDCLGGQWVNGDATQSTRAVNYRILSPDTAAQTSGAVFGTNSTTVAKTLYCTELDLPYSKLLTGIGVHIGTTGGTDKWVVGLYDSGGNLIASSAAAGVTVGSGYAYQAEAFTSQYYAVGPAQYFACVITNGTTATLDTVTTGLGDYVLAKSYTNATFVLPTSFTPPTSFNSVSGPYAYVY